MRVVLANRNIAVAHGLTLLLQTYGDFDTVVEVSRLDQVLARARELQADLVIIDPEFPGLNLPELLRGIRTSLPKAATVVTTDSHEPEHLYSSIRGGATAFVSMDTDPEKLVALLRLAAEGHVLISASMVSLLSDLIAGVAPSTPEAPPSLGHGLSERELQVLNLVAGGATNREIAHSLVLTENTIKVHMRNILQKLQLRNRQQATVYALQAGLVSDVSILPLEDQLLDLPEEAPT